MVHSHVSSPEEDVIFIAAKDTRHGIVGPAVDGRHNGPRTLPGFGDNKDNEWPLGPDGLPLPQSPRVSNENVRYVYRWDELDRVPDGQCSANCLRGVETLWASHATKHANVSLRRSSGPSWPRPASHFASDTPHEAPMLP